MRALTSRPFGVNLWLHTDMVPPVDVAKIPAATVQAVRRTLDGLRAQLGLPPSPATPTSSPDIIGGAFDVILEERVPVFTAAVGEPTPDMIRRCHAQGTKVFAMVTTVRQARAAEGGGVDVIVAQGSEAGGHRSLGTKSEARDAAGIGTLALVPQSSTPPRAVVAAAASRWRGLAACSRSAAGRPIGTRSCYQESMVAEFGKAVLRRRAGDRDHGLVRACGHDTRNAYTTSTRSGSAL